MTEVIQKSIENLSKDIAEIQDSSQKILGEYLLKRFADDENLAIAWLDKNRSIKNAWKYIYGQAKNQPHHGSAVAIADDQVYSWAIHYVLDEPNDLVKQQLEDSQKQEVKKQTKKQIQEKKQKQFVKALPKDMRVEGQGTLFDLEGGE